MVYLLNLPDAMYATKAEYNHRREQAKKAAEQHKKAEKGKQKILVKHPTIPNTWIEKTKD